MGSPLARASSLAWPPLKAHCALDINRTSCLIGVFPPPPASQLNARDASGQTPLHVACERGDVVCVRELLEESQARTDIADHNGETPMHCAAKQETAAVVKVTILSPSFSTVTVSMSQHSFSIVLDSYCFYAKVNACVLFYSHSRHFIPNRLVVQNRSVIYRSRWELGYLSQTCQQVDCEHGTSNPGFFRWESDTPMAQPPLTHTF